MGFGDDFAAALSDNLGIQVDPSSFESADQVSQELAGYEDFINGLDELSLATLNAVVEAGVDLSQGEDEEGPLNLPGGFVFALAASVQLPVHDVAEAVSSSIESATGIA
jgi:hypothetical protein